MQAIRSSSLGWMLLRTESANRTQQPRIPVQKGTSVKTTVQFAPTKERSFIRSSEAKSLQDLTPQQWKSGIAAWLGWLFDGLDMHLVHAGGGAVCDAAASCEQPCRPLGKAAQLMDSGGIPHWLGARWWILRPGGRPPRPQPCFKPDHRHLRLVHRAFLLCSDLVAPAHLSFPRGIGYRWRVGRRLFVAFGDLAETLGTMGGCRASDRGQYRSAAGMCHNVSHGRAESAMGFPGGNSPRFAGVLDSTGGAGTGGMAPGQGRVASAAPGVGLVSRRSASHQLSRRFWFAP